MVKNKIRSLDGIRGIAAISVLFSHVFLWFDPYLHAGKRASESPSEFSHWLFNSPFTFFYKGESAVWLFFVLSGFVLSRGILKKKEDISAIRTAAEKRYFRLGIPVFAAILIGYALMTLGVFKSAEFGLTNKLSEYYLFESNLWEAISHGLWGSLIYGEYKYDYVLWTISIELYGSFMIFALVALFARRLNLLRLVSIGVILGCMGGSNSMLSSMGLFSFGLLLASFSLPKNSASAKKILAFTTLIFGLYLAGYSPHSESYSIMVSLAHIVQGYSGWSIHWPHLYPQVGAALIVSCILIHPGVFNLLEKSFFQWLGHISFSFYLLHSFILALVAPYLTVALPKYEAMALTLLIVLVITLIASHVFYRYVDKPAVSLVSRHGYKTLTTDEQLQTAP